VSESLLLNPDSPIHIAVEGNIGAGKSKLANKLAEEFSLTPLMEEKHNPFLEDFYRSPNHYALAAQLHFLFSRSRVNRALVEQNLFSNRFVSDFLIDKELLFAAENLSDDEYQLYKQVHGTLHVDTVIPHLVIYLQSDIATCRRNLSSSQSNLISDEYLNKMNDAYTRFFHFYDKAPLIIVNASEIDMESDDEFSAFCDTLRSHSHGRTYYNPMPIAI